MQEMEITDDSTEGDILRARIISDGYCNEFFIQTEKDVRLVYNYIQDNGL